MPRKRYTEEEVKEALRDNGLTKTREVVDDVGMSRRVALEKLEALSEKDEVKKLELDDNYFVWSLVEEGDE